MLRDMHVFAIIWMARIIFLIVINMLHTFFKRFTLQQTAISSTNILYVEAATVSNMELMHENCKEMMRDLGCTVFVYLGVS